MKVISFNGRFLGRRTGGVERVAFELLSALDALLDAEDPIVSEMSFRVLAPRGVNAYGLFRKIPVECVGRLKGQLWEQLELPFYARNSFLVNCCNTAPAFMQRQLSIIHDVATVRCPEAYGRLFRLWYRLLVPRVYRSSASVCTVSQFSKAELKVIYGPRDDVGLIPLAVDHMHRFVPDHSIFERTGVGAKPYVLAVSSLSPHKNFDAILAAFSQLGLSGVELVIAGGANSKVFAGGGGNLGGMVRAVGYVSDSELKALYESALCFVFPSLYEGYGLPPVEAMSCGCPVLASNAASIPEVCGDAAVYFDPTNIDQLASQLVRLFDDPATLELMRSRGFERSARLSWRKSAAILVEEIRKVLR